MPQLYNPSARPIHARSRANTTALADHTRQPLTTRKGISTSRQLGQLAVSMAA